MDLKKSPIFYYLEKLPDEKQLKEFREILAREYDTSKEFHKRCYFKGTTRKTL